MHHNTVCYLESLPIELLQEIIGLLLKSSPNPSSSANDEEWHHNDSESDMHDSLNTFTPAVGLDSAWTIPLRNAGNVLATFTGDTAQTRAFVSSSSSPLAGTDVSLSPIKALRRTSRYFNELCKPLLYRNLNILSTPQILSVAKILDHVIIPYWDYITDLRLSIGFFSFALGKWVRLDRYAPIILSACKSVRSFSLYYTRIGEDFYTIAQALLKRLQDQQSNKNGKGQLTSIGIYSNAVVNGYFNKRYWQPPAFNGPAALLDILASSETAAAAVETLDVVTECLPKETYDRIRSGFKNLRSLTIRMSFENSLGDIWNYEHAYNSGHSNYGVYPSHPYSYGHDERHSRPSSLGRSQEVLWSPKRNLTRLCLIECENVHACQVPGLVQHFGSIRDLVVIACGSNSNGPIHPIHPINPVHASSISHVSHSTYPSYSVHPLHAGVPAATRSRGWSGASNALCKMRDPLRTFRIERMYEHQIMALGVIPVTTLMVVSKQFVKLMVLDGELFPELAVLKVPAPSTTAASSSNINGSVVQKSVDDVYQGMTLDNICKARGVELGRDLIPIPLC